MNTQSLNRCLALGFALGLLTYGSSVVEAQTARSAALAESDPSGGVLTVTAVTVVFSALVLLAVIFTVIGRLMQRSQTAPLPKSPQSHAPAEYKGATSQSPTPSPEAIIAISLALGAEQARPTDEVALAIALSLESYRACQHDAESYVLTINPRRQTAWNGRALSMRGEVKRW